MLTGAHPRADGRRFAAGARTTLVGVLAGAALLTGCGRGATRLHAEKAVFDYQTAIGQINAGFAVPAASPTTGLQALGTALAKYRVLTPPASLRALHSELVGSLQTRISATADAQRALAVGDPLALRVAVARSVGAQRRLARELHRLSVLARRCRLDRSNC